MRTYGIRFGIGERKLAIRFGAGERKLADNMRELLPHWGLRAIYELVDRRLAQAE